MKILFVCTGNTCRSPMAEALFRQMDKEGTHEVRSAGIAACDGLPASANATQILQNRGIHCNHTTKRVNKELIDWADLILTMTFSHKLFLLNQYDEAKEKIFTLKEYVTTEEELETDEKLNWDISDPFGGDLEEYKACAEEIESSLEKLYKLLER
jgi:protein-tyrosine-phosphatase